MAPTRSARKDRVASNQGSLKGAIGVVGPRGLTDICALQSDTCMRTTLSFDDHLFREAKAAAAHDGETLTQLIERAVAQYLHHRRARGRTPFRLELLVKEGRPTPGVNFDDRDSLYEWMEGRG